MFDLAVQAAQGAHSGSQMRPRRWYADEIAPQQRRNVKLDARNWRYRSYVRRKHTDAAPKIGAASLWMGHCQCAGAGRRVTS